MKVIVLRNWMEVEYHVVGLKKKKYKAKWGK
jgi:hypothetical protein